MIFVTFFTLLVTLAPSTSQPPSTPSTDPPAITLSETYWSETACTERLPAMRQIVDALTTTGIRLLDGAGCVPIAEDATSDVPAPVVVASR